MLLFSVTPLHVVVLLNKVTTYFSYLRTYRVDPNFRLFTRSPPANRNRPITHTVKCRTFCLQQSLLCRYSKM